MTTKKGARIKAGMSVMDAAKAYDAYIDPSDEIDEAFASSLVGTKKGPKKKPVKLPKLPKNKKNEVEWTNAYQARQAWKKYKQQREKENNKVGNQLFRFHWEGFIQARLEDTSSAKKGPPKQYLVLSVKDIFIDPWYHNGHEFEPGEYIGGWLTFRHQDLRKRGKGQIIE